MRTPPSLQWPPADRTLHLIDAENLAGARHTDSDAIASAGALYRNLVCISPTDLLVVACHLHLAFAAKEGWPSSRLLVGHGPSGADRQLVQDAEPADIGRRFSRLVIASGDGIFTELAIRARWQGVEVTVIARRASLSKRLGRVAHLVQEFPELRDFEPTAAVAV